MLPEEVARWTMATLRNRLVKIDARIVRHGPLPADFTVATRPDHVQRHPSEDQSGHPLREFRSTEPGRPIQRKQQ